MKIFVKPLLSRMLTPFLLTLILATCGGCSIRFSFSGASIGADVKTVSVTYFPNMSALVAPILSPTLTDELTNKISRETRLQFVREDADVSFEGEILDYISEPVAISGGEYAIQNRLTIVVKVRFVNKKQPQFSYETVFKESADYNTSQMLTSIEGTLIPQIVEKLVEDIFNAAFSNW